MKNVILMLLALVALQGCQKQSAWNRQEAKSLDFYSQNIEAANAVAEKCMDFERKELSKLQGDQQREWQDSSDGINCINAKTAMARHAIAERNRQLRESDARLRNM